MARPIRILPASNEQKHELQSMINRPMTPQREARRARIILHRITGLNQEQTARAEGVNRPVVVQWETYLQNRDLSPKRYVWKAEGQAILQKIQRARAAIEEKSNV